MPDPEILRLLREGPEAFNRWRQRNRDVQVDLRDADLRGASFRDCNLDKADFTRAILRGTDFTRSSLVGATLDEADLSPDGDQPTRFSQSNCQAASFSKANLRGITADNGTLFMDSRFEFAELTEAKWVGSQAANANFRGAKLSGVNFSGVDMRHALLCDVDARATAFGPSDFSGSNMASASAERAKFVGAVLQRTGLQGAKLGGADLTASNIRGAIFVAADLRGADLRDVRPDRATSFEQAIVSAARINRYTLEYLKDYGGLTAAERAEMAIVNDVARLRQNFSGVFAIVHLVALVLFVAPYAWFILSHYAAARFVSANSDDPTLLVALLRFVVSGGREWRSWSPSWLVLLFLSLLGYNVLRACLLYKTKSLELEELTTGLPSRFSFSSNVAWGGMFTTARWLFWFVILVVALHTLNFLFMRIPS